MRKKMVKNTIILCTIMILISWLAAAAGNSTLSSVSQSNTGATNMVVDFSLTRLDSKLSTGDSGIMNLVIKNAGGREAKNVEVYIPSTGSISVNKRQFIGQMDAGESKAIPIILRIESSARPGLNVIQARIYFDGYNANGKAEDNQMTIWEIPITVYSNPLFQINPESTDYYLDTTSDLILDGTVQEDVKDLEATLSSNCITVIGSAQSYIGDVPAGQKFTVKYRIKPTTTGACQFNLALAYADQSGGRSSSTMSFGLNVQDAGVDIKITEISYKPTGPGETVNVSLTLKNIGGANAQDTTVILGVEDPFAPLDTPEKYVGTIGAGKEVKVVFPLSISWGASTQTYTLPVTITYKLGGKTYSVGKKIGLDVRGKVILSVINVDTSTGNIRIDVANLGTRDASSVKGTLMITSYGNQTGFGGMRPGGQNRSGGNSPAPMAGGQVFNTTRQGGAGFTGEPVNTQTYVTYKSDIKAGKQSTFSFAASGTGLATLILEYNGENNQRITQRETIYLNSRAATANMRVGNTRGGGTDYAQIGLYALGALIILFAAYKIYRKKKK